MIAEFEVSPRSLNSIKFSVDDKGNVKVLEKEESTIRADLWSVVDAFLIASGTRMEDLKKRTREQDYLFLRYLFCLLCIRRGFKEAEVAPLLNVHRSSIYHAVDSAELLIQQQFPKFMKYYNKLKPFFPEL